MDKFEIKPGFITKNSIIVLIFFLLPVVIVGLILNSRLAELQSCTTCDQSPLIIVRVFFIGLFVGLVFLLLSLKNRKIRVDKNLVFFMKKSWFSSWSTDMLIDFSKIDIIKDRTKQVFTGKAAITYRWLIFVMKDKSNQELLLNGYDYAGIKNLFFYIRGRYPDVKFDNDLYRDSSEKLAGIDLSKN
jgi:hypothetical protein